MTFNFCAVSVSLPPPPPPSRKCGLFVEIVLQPVKSFGLIESVDGKGEGNGEGKGWKGRGEEAPKDK